VTLPFLRPRILLAASLSLGAMVPLAAQGERSAVSGFLAETEAVLEDLERKATLAEWDSATDTSTANDAKTVAANKAFDEEKKRRSSQARAIDQSAATTDEKRKLLLLKLAADGIVADPARNERLLQVKRVMGSNYSKACPVVHPDQRCMEREKIEAEIGRSRDAVRLMNLWTAWYDTARPIRDVYAEYAALSNQGARDSGYRDASVMSKAAYEVDPEELERDLDNLWNEIRPLYLLIHSYVRKRLC
jgi:peptidyl-dipeptidase A